VFWNNEVVHTLRLAREGLLAATPLPTANAFPDWSRDAGDRWHGFAARARVLIVNTQLVSAADMPQSIFDLTHERWRGRVGIAKPLFGTTASHVAVLFSTLGPEKASEYLLALKANGVKVLSGNKACAELVGKGDLAVAFTDTDDALAELDAGRPVRVIFPDQQPDQIGTLLLPNTLMRIAGSPNPDGAAQLIEYLRSPEVEARLANGPSGQIPLHPQVTARSRVMPDAPIRAMAVDFAAAAESFDAAARFIEREFLE
jgi:iron(III) transport system substrate-binding protein